MPRSSLWLPLALAYLFLASALPANAQSAGEGEGEGEGESRVSVSEGAPLELECRLRPEQRAQWRLEGAPLPADLRAAAEAPAPDGRLAARLHAAAARAHHAGLYTCSADGRRGPRVRVVVLPPPDEAGAGPAAAGEEPESKETLFEVRLNITLNCALANPDGLPYVWTKNDTNIEQVSDLKGRYKLERSGAELVVQHSAEDDFGNYTCALSGRADPPPQRWTLRGRTTTKLPPDSNVVEGQKLKLQCKVVGKPYPRVVWTVTNSTDEKAEGVEVRLALGDRVTLRRSEQGAEDGELVLETVQRSDAGRYACDAPLPGAGAPLPAGAGAPHRGTTTLHVKDMYAALWPFLGICFEVFVLCTIILVYEKRRTKPDLDDSDTDNHDQKKS